MDTLDISKLNVSLESHLVEKLKPLSDLLPPALAEELKPYVPDATKDVIPYSTLLAISQWSRTTEGKKKLSKRTPLDSSDYMMVSLLAGTTTSPERNYGSYVPPPEPEELAARQKRERQEITAILNGLLSIFGVGFATWWAGDKLHWKNHWRVLLALASALIVAVAESGLFIIWRSRQSSSGTRIKSRSKAPGARHKKDDNDGNEVGDSKIDSIVHSSEQMKSPTSNLRQRRL
ncbi:hypothetical protein NP233_g3433 [Leucocoprinus birnbaumii]|uniref:Endoplasmic reticulum-based factor for assembly of V-ATPase n=1 Tax=Leucocoprinus birnbaumii TaxID=56174 RepID=A0AAD5YST9_9AGAR|nr:hypothetical protein NP233_g3433 [Leucocoprinus birnbaumii]